jgi:hypothetical protein
LQEVAVDTKEEIVVVAEAVAEVEVEVEVGVVGAAETAIGFAPIQGDFFYSSLIYDLFYCSCPYF